MATTDYIRYRADYKYQLAEMYIVNTGIVPQQAIDTDFIDLDLTGKLTIKVGYAWDGPSGPVIDTHKNMRASLVHDAFYQLMRNEHLRTQTYRKLADELFRRQCIQDGVRRGKAKIWYQALRKLGWVAASPRKVKDIDRAPKE
jgi:hypothetical protein